MSLLLLLLAVFLVALNAYLLGFLFIPGKEHPRRSRYLWWMVSLYASILIGIVLGFQSGRWQSGTVPLEPLKKPEPSTREMTLEEVVQESESWFPPEIEVDESDPDWVVFQAPEREEMEIVPGGGIFDTSGSAAVVGDGEAKILGYAIHPPRFEEIEEIPGEEGQRRVVRRETGPATLWAPDGTPLDDLPRFESSSGAWDTWDYQGKFCLSFPGDWRLSGVHSTTCRQIPWGEPQTGDRSLRDGILWSRHTLQLPVPSPVELCVGVYEGAEEIHTISAREGVKLTLARNRLILVKILSWKHISTGGGAGDTIRLARPAGHDAEGESGVDPFTTAVFYCLEPQALKIQAVLDSGKTISSGEWITTQGWLCCRFHVEIDKIKEFRILEEPDVFEIVFHLPDIKGFPSENDGVTNRLDVFYPEVILLDTIFSSIRYTHEGRLVRFLQDVLGNRFVPDGTALFPGTTKPDMTPVEYEDVTIRQLLDRNYPDRWWVKNGVVYTTNNRFGPIVWKVTEAGKALGEAGRRQ